MATIEGDESTGMTYNEDESSVQYVSPRFDQGQMIQEMIRESNDN